MRIVIKKTGGESLPFEVEVTFVSSGGSKPPPYRFESEMLLVCSHLESKKL